MRLLTSREIAERVVRSLQLAVRDGAWEPGKTAETKDQPDPTTRAALAIQRSVEVNQYGTRHSSSCPTSLLRR